MINFDPSDLVDVVRRTAEEVVDSVDEPVLRAVGFAGADIFRNQAKLNAQAHIQTGTLHRNIIVKRIEEESDGGNRQVYIVTVRRGKRGGDDAYYGPWVESGHKYVPPNTNVSKRSGKKVNWESHRQAAELEYGTSTVPAYPYMRPAYESRKQDAVDAMTETLMAQLQRNATR